MEGREASACVGRGRNNSEHEVRILWIDVLV